MTSRPAPRCSPGTPARAELLYRLALVVLACVALTFQDSSTTNTYDYSRGASVLVSVEVRPQPPRLRLVWAPEPQAEEFIIFRKLVGASDWGRPLARLEGTVTSWDDLSAQSGVAYEYAVVKRYRLYGRDYLGAGYVCAGVQVPMIDRRGTVLLVVDRTRAPGLRPELARLEQDLVGDGWQVIRHDVDPGDTPPRVKSLIQADYAADPEHVTAVFLLGHVPVPRSGWEAPDGHADHLYAWPADTYYADMQGAWTDYQVNARNPRSGTSNLPGDGIFDQSALPSDLALEVGRVDLHDMPAFHLDEESLLRRYLDKDHAWRQAHLPVPARGYVSDSFRTAGFSFAQNGYRNFAALCGYQQVTAGRGLPTDGYLWAYGCGSGSYTSAAGVADTRWLARRDPHLVFTLLYGSYFGDWDSRNCLLRAPLATATCGLTCCWAASPNYFFHHLALGWNIGYSVRLSQNNFGLYDPPSSHGLPRGVWSALMGDPTLRLQPVPPPVRVAAALTSAGVKLTWLPSGHEVAGYALYRSRGLAGPFLRLTPALVAGTSYLDTARLPGPRRYLVRAVVLQTSPAGSYYNPSQGVFTGWVG
jgi:hypothetical protein